MTYVVAGVTGNTGKVVAETLLAAGKKVRVLARDAAKAESLRAKGAEVVVADLSDTAALTAALQGASGAYVLVPPSMVEPDFRAYQRRIGTSIAEAARASGVAHLVLLSSVGAQHPAKTGPIAGLFDVEAALRAVSSLSLTSVRAAYFMENLGGSLGQLAEGKLPSFFPADFKFDMIATHDIGKVAAQALLEGPRGKVDIIELGGPPVSMADVAKELGVLTGKSVTVTEAPVAVMAQALQGFGFPATMAALYQEMTESILNGHVAFEGGHRRIEGQTRVGTVLKRLLG
jgi:uncharacterized protein YbjT (DUF2867 family)